MPDVSTLPDLAGGALRATILAQQPELGTWRDWGRCRSLDPAIFHPDEGDDALAAEAKAICAPCPVRAACLDHALAARENEGIWGGLTARERRRLVRRHRRLAAPTTEVA